MTEVEGTVLVEYHHETGFIMLYTIVCECAIKFLQICFLKLTLLHMISELSHESFS